MLSLFYYKKGVLYEKLEQMSQFMDIANRLFFYMGIIKYIRKIKQVEFFILKTVYMCSKEDKEVFMNIRELVINNANANYPNNDYVSERVEKELHYFEKNK